MDSSLIKPKEEDIKFECQICISQIDNDRDAFPLINCEHLFHKKCLEQYLKTEVSQSKCPLTCCDPKCRKELAAKDLKGLLSRKDYESFQNYSLQQALSKQGDVSWCPTPNCNYAFVFDRARDSEDFKCIKCKKEYCLDCKSDAHKKQSCEEFKRNRDPNLLDKAFESFVKGSKFKQCPKCTMWVEKTDGCNHMRCRCGTEFCYVCGGYYMRCACVNGGRAAGAINPLRNMHNSQNCRNQ